MYGVNGSNPRSQTSYNSTQPLEWINLSKARCLQRITKLHHQTQSFNKAPQSPDLSGLTHQKKLFLSNKELTSVPDLSGFSQMEEIDLSNNWLSALPDSILFLPMKCKVNVQNNLFTPQYVQKFMERLQVLRALHPDQGPSIQFSISSTPLSLLELARKISKTDKNPHFDFCQDIHQLFEAIFPPSRKTLPEHWRAVVAQIPKSSSLVELEKSEIALSILQTRVPNQKIDRLFSEDSNRKIDLIVKNLCEASTFFAKAWELANRKIKLTIEEAGKMEPDNAKYTPKPHRIYLDKYSIRSIKIMNIVFETINALQGDSLSKIFDLAGEGKVGREEYALLIEWVEQNSIIWRQKISDQLRLSTFDLQMHDFPFQWNFSNKPAPDRQFPHAEKYRRTWDSAFSFKYFATNPDVKIPSANTRKESMNRVSNPRNLTSYNPTQPSEWRDLFYDRDLRAAWHFRRTIVDRYGLCSR